LLPDSCWFFAWHIFLSWSRTRRVLLKRHLTLNGLQGIISQKIELYIATAVKNSNLTTYFMIPMEEIYVIFFNIMKLTDKYIFVRLCCFHLKLKA
jgi:hypothetical protein